MMNEVFVVSTILLFIVTTMNITFAFIDGGLSLSHNKELKGVFKSKIGKSKLDGMDI